MKKVMDCASFRIRYIIIKTYAVIYTKIDFIFTHGVNNIFYVNSIICLLICILNLLIH